jgi:dTDP-4-dehydrorhamnose 3,5-epimerase-like enzyme
MIPYRLMGRFIRAADRNGVGDSKGFAHNFLAHDDNAAKTYVVNWLEDKKKTELMMLLRIDTVEETCLVKQYVNEQ